MERVFEFAVNHWILVSAFFALLAALFFVEGRRAGRQLTSQELVRLMNDDAAVIVDVRERKDFSEGHIKGSLHIPFTSLKERAAELQKHASKQIVLVDKMGQHSGMAGKQLRAAGLENVVRLAGGITEWRNSNLPVVKK
ncbi:MAG: rhodanese-like domain-containing protein [Gammaproteobacteria bacterium]|nr:rhodanese-like domain-containing protein [Gammaproteobacteria bacterium]